jgi:hypothetical protein
MAPVPPNITVPVLVKPVPASLMVCVAAGEMFSVPLLVTVPLFVNDP